jgi:tetratricopeptide (TPR) repeat protein
VSPHPPRPALLAFVRSLPPEGAGFFRHLLSCRRCRRAALASLSSLETPELPGEGSAAGPAVDYDAVFARLEAAQPAAVAGVERERREAERLAGELAAMPEAGREPWLAGLPSFPAWAVADSLLCRAYREAFHDPAAGAGLAGLALSLAERLVAAGPGAAAGAPAGTGLLAHAWATVGHVRRLAADLDGAEAAFREAARHLPEPLDAPDRATYCRDLALLRRDQGANDEALALFRRAAALFQEVRDLPGESAVLRLEGWLRLEEGDLEPAHACFSQAASAAVGHPAGQAEARFGIAFCLAEMNQRTAARREIEQARRLAAGVPAAAPLFARLEARVRLCLGEPTSTSPGGSA